MSARAQTEVNTNREKSMRKSWKVLPLTAAAVVAMQFSILSPVQAQTVGGTVGGTTAGTSTTTAGTTTGTTGGTAPRPIVAQPRFTG